MIERIDNENLQITLTVTKSDYHNILKSLVAHLSITGEPLTTNSDDRYFLGLLTTELLPNEKNLTLH